MKAAFLNEPGNLGFGEIEKPEIKPSEVLIKVKYAGICGTDPHIYKGRFPVSDYPLVQGHEFSGEIVNKGDEVEYLEEGNKVTVDINLGCGHCPSCRKMEKLHCPNLRQIGIHLDGAFAEYVKAPADQVIKLPRDVSLKQGALVEPISCVVHSIKKAEIEVGDSILIIGGGPMGLLHQQLASIRGGYPIIVTEIKDARIKKAEELGADRVIAADKENVEERVMSITDGRGPDIVIEAVGSRKTYEQAFDLVNESGTIISFGAAGPEEEIDVKPFEIYEKEYQIKGTYASAYKDWQDAIELIKNPRFEADSLISDVLPLEELEKGYEKMISGEAIKILVSPVK